MIGNFQTPKVLQQLCEYSKEKAGGETDQTEWNRRIGGSYTIRKIYQVQSLDGRPYCTASRSGNDCRVNNRLFHST